MKNLLLAGVLALVVGAVSEQQASAWCDTKFSIGLNFQHASGGNSWLWGAFKNGQPPGCPDCINCAPNCPGAYYRNIVNYGVPPAFGQGGPGPIDFGHGGPAIGPGPVAPAVPTPPVVPAPTQLPGADHQVYWFNTPTYSNVNFHPSYYQQGGYFMPISNNYR